MNSEQGIGKRERGEGEEQCYLVMNDLIDIKDEGE